MNKEKLILSKVHKYDYPEDWDGYKLIQDTEKDFDKEKGFINHEIIIQRISDMKYFKFTYTEFGHNGSDLLEQVAGEVVRKEKITYYYE
jgi:hypothetical protein